MKLRIKQILHIAVIAAGLFFSQAASAKAWLFELTGDFSKTWVMTTGSLQGDPESYIYGDQPYQWGFEAGLEISFFKEGGVEMWQYGKYFPRSLILRLESALPLYLSSGGHFDSFDEGTFALKGSYASISGPIPGDFTLKILRITEVPEPETYGMLLAGLGLMVAVARRRQKSA